MTAAAPPVFSCPLPPSDFSARPIPIKTLNLAATTLFRIHSSTREPMHWNRPDMTKARFRFDAPNNEFGVLYASLTFSACMFETIVRDKFQGKTLPLLIDESALSNRSVSQIGLSDPRALRLADFTASLTTVGGSTAIMAIDTYDIPNQWALGVFLHYEKLDGIYFQSRFSNDFCVALFHHAPAVLRGAPVSLLAAPELDAFLTQFNIAIPPGTP